MRALLVVAGAIGATFATLGAAAAVAICELAGAPAPVTAVAALGGGAVAGLLGTLASLVLPVPRAPDAADADAALRDATELRSALQRLQAEHDALEARFRSSVEVRDAFLARMSHELRTPLNAILGYVELLHDEAEGEARQDLERIRAAALNLLAIVTSVLDLTQLQSGAYDVQPEPILVAGLVKQVVDSVRTIADANGDELTAEVDPQLEAVLDRRMLQSVLFNLASNGCKYTANGRVSITAREVGERLLLEVKDTGIGMTERQVEEAFRPFSQGDESLTRRYDGAGLGLAVVRGLVEAMGGTVAIESAPGKGATVRVDLPIEIVAREGSGLEDEPTMLLR